MKKPLAIYWFRQDLRLSDNPALTAAIKAGNILPVYILDDDNSGSDTMGAASRWWLHHSLASLNESLGEKLNLYQGNAKEILTQLIDKYDITSIHWNRCYEPWRVARDTEMKEYLTAQSIAVHSHNGSLLWEPWAIKKQDGTAYKVFTPFYRRGCLNAEPPREPLPAPTDLACIKDDDSLPLNALELLPKIRWDRQLKPHWNIGEKAARQRFEQFLKEGLAHYKEGRNLPAKPYVSRLSPHLHLGEISPNQLWYAARMRGENSNIDHFCSELGWREFSYHLLYENPDIRRKNIQTKFDRFPWDKNENALLAWQHGQTGVPIVDAGMRELWQTGFMHNRVRMIVGSFLVKNLRIHWHEGEKWFWDCLVDADMASNSASWQWIAGCGADAAPYFRIFNPVTQGQKFDADGDYTRHYVPELKDLPNKYLFNPWEAPELILSAAGITLGETYPTPIVDLKASRNAALAAFRSLKQQT